MKLYTKVEIGDKTQKIGFGDRIMSLGSCFAENIGLKLYESKFKILNNPFGIVYNPLSIFHSLDRLIKGTPVLENELQPCQDTYCHFDFHGRFNEPNKSKTLTNINNSVRDGNLYISKGFNTLILTFGTAFVFKNIESGKVSNNCHKMPAKLFERTLLPVNEMFTALNPILFQLKDLNPSLKVILTVSPVRHLRDGLIANQRSKARCIELAHQLKDQHEFIDYFPSYEIQMDELRDYRFYNTDLFHPSEQAINYIWEQFKKVYISKDRLESIESLAAIRRNLEHKPFSPESGAYQAFINKTESAILQYEKQYGLSLEIEKEKIIVLKQFF